MDNVCLVSTHTYVHTMDEYHIFIHFQCSAQIVTPINRARLQFNLFHLSFFIIVRGSTSAHRLRFKNYFQLCAI